MSRDSGAASSPVSGLRRLVREEAWGLHFIRFFETNPDDIDLEGIVSADGCTTALYPVAGAGVMGFFSGPGALR